MKRGRQAVHELGITQEIVEIVRDEGATHGAAKVLRAYLEVGSLTGYSPESIGYYFDLFKTDHPSLSQTVLEIKRIPAVLTCHACGTQHVLDDFLLQCPACDSLDTERNGGDTLIVTSLEVEDDDERSDGNS